MKIIDGKAVSLKVKDELKEQTKRLAQEQGFVPCLAVIIVGEDPASQVYVSNKKKACEYIGYKSLGFELPESTTQQELLELIEKLVGEGCHIIVATNDADFLAEHANQIFILHKG